MLHIVSRSLRSCTGYLARAAAACAILIHGQQTREMNCAQPCAVHLPQGAQHKPATKVLSGLWKIRSHHFIDAVLLLLLSAISLHAAAITPPGTAIDNTVTASFDFSGTVSSSSSSVAGSRHSRRSSRISSGSSSSSRKRSSSSRSRSSSSSMSSMSSSSSQWAWL